MSQVSFTDAERQDRAERLEGLRRFYALGGPESLERFEQYLKVADHLEAELLASMAEQSDLVV